MLVSSPKQTLGSLIYPVSETPCGLVMLPCLESCDPPASVHPGPVLLGVSCRREGSRAMPHGAVPPACCSHAQGGEGRKICKILACYEGKVYGCS